jgi:integrase
VEDRELLEALARRLTLTPPSSGVTGIALGALWMSYKTTLARGRSFQLIRNLLRPFVVKFWRRPASSLSPADWLEHRRDRKKTKTRLGRSPCDLTLNLEMKAAKRLLTYGVDEGKLPRHPFRAVKPVKTRTRRESWFTAVQIDDLLEAGRQLRWDHQQRTFRALVAVMADTGLRISEALSLRWDRITLRGTTSVLGKGAKTRVIAFTPRAIDMLAKLDRHQSSPLVFVNFRSWKKWDASTVRAWFRKAIEIARLEGVKADGDLALVPHLLRHSFASIADERRASPAMIQLALGHSSMATTQVYLHRSNADAAKKMAVIMGGRRPPKKVKPLSTRLPLGNTVETRLEQNVRKNTLKRVLLT